MFAANALEKSEGWERWILPIMMPLFAVMLLVPKLNPEGIHKLDDWALVIGFVFASVLLSIDRLLVWRKQPAV